MKKPRLRVVRGDKPVWWDETNNRAMVISRVSDKKQEDGQSPKMQESIASGYAEGIVLEVVAVITFTESAKDTRSRKQFHAAVEDARRRKIKHLVFYMWDRVARNNTDAENLERLIRDGELVVHEAKSGTVLHAESTDAEWDDFESAIFHAKKENRSRRTKTIDGMTSRAEMGWAPGRLPWFYRHVPAFNEQGERKKRGGTVGGPSEEGRRLLRRELELHLAGYSLDQIRATCLAEGLVPAKYVRRYYRSVIDKHLKTVFFAALPAPYVDPKNRTEVFRSNFPWRGKLYPGKHEPVFTADEWELLKASFGQRSIYRKLKHVGLFAQGLLSLRCAAADCNCKVTYAPKSKANGVTYAYYRCADGRRVHRDRGEPQLNVLEDDILQQLGAALNLIGLTSEIAEAIANELNATHREAMASKASAATAYKAEIEELEKREDQLFDLFASGAIDQPAHKRQLERLRAERQSRFDKLRETDIETDNAYLLTAQHVLELAIRAKSLWEGRTPMEKRDVLQRVVCNPRLDGRTVRYDLQKPFAILARMNADGDGRPQRDSNPC